jgi:hypothetical protein
MSALLASIVSPLMKSYDGHILLKQLISTVYKLFVFFIFLLGVATIYLKSLPFGIDITLLEARLPTNFNTN